MKMNGENSKKQRGIKIMMKSDEVKSNIGSMKKI